MKLYFFRHGEAIDDPSDDYQRTLTTRGRARVQGAAQVLLRMGVLPTVIYTSPRVRAKQTADILAAAFQLPLYEREDLDYPHFDVRVLERLIKPHDQEAEIWLVGHEPTFSEVVRELSGAEIEMKKGGLARVDLTSYGPPTGALVWLIAPKVFDALGASTS